MFHTFYFVLFAIRKFSETNKCYFNIIATPFMCVAKNDKNNS